MLPPINVDGTAKGESRRHWTIEFEFNDKEKWLNVLADVKAKANQNVRKFLEELNGNTADDLPACASTLEAWPGL